MKIGLVMHPYGEKAAAGLGTSIYDLSKALIEADTTNSYHIFVKGEEKNAPSFSGSFSFTALKRGLLWMEQLKSHPDVNAFIFFMPVMPLFFVPKKSIVIVRDFGYKHVPARTVRHFLNNFALHWVNKIAFARASKIVAISDATRTEAIRHFNIPEDKIVTIYNGHRNFARIQEEPMEKIQEPFFLFVGVVKERKNVERLIRAFAAFKQTDTAGFKLYIAGKCGGAYGRKLIELTENLGLSEDVVFLGYVTDGNVSFLYRHAHAFVFPSLLEGFGKPVLEAMDCGAPVITSNTGALAEVGGNAALLIDPRDIDSIAGGLTRIANNSELRNTLQEAGKKRAALFSWEKTAEAFQRILRTI